VEIGAIILTFLTAVGFGVGMGRHLTAVEPACLHVVVDCVFFAFSTRTIFRGLRQVGRPIEAACGEQSAAEFMTHSRRRATNFHALTR
jgi:hypothetical protein